MKAYLKVNKLASDQWHRRYRDQAWTQKRIGLGVLEPIVRNKYNIYAETKYNAEQCRYDIVLDVGPGGPCGPMGRLPPVNILFTHVEDCMVFPSDHLKAKLMLLVG